MDLQAHARVSADLEEAERRAMAWMQEAEQRISDFLDDEGVTVMHPNDARYFFFDQQRIRDAIRQAKENS